uniref:(northern house mosquito) hypothetical protein n=1 Tax=Culex pipiens TaxID=7175 RepID=A0A8D8N7G8_CULPI
MGRLVPGHWRLPRSAPGGRARREDRPEVHNHVAGLAVPAELGFNHLRQWCRNAVRWPVSDWYLNGSIVRRGTHVHLGVCGNFDSRSVGRVLPAVPDGRNSVRVRYRSVRFLGFAERDVCRLSGATDCGDVHRAGESHLPGEDGSTQ